MPLSPNQQTSILLIGAGELGTAVLWSLSSLPNTQITLGVRNPSDYVSLTAAHPSLTLLAIDVSSTSITLVPIFAQFDIILSCTGFGQEPSSLLKLTRDVLEAGRRRKREGKERLWFFPWQWGVDYDVTGDGEGMMPLFGVQKQVRQLLRSEAEQAGVKWTVVSTGVFMSFLFEDSWGVISGHRDDAARDGGKKITIRALGDWQHKITVTDVGDIGRVVARIATGEVGKQAENGIVYVAGDTLSYGQLADTIERVTGEAVEREEWSIPYLEGEVVRDPEDGLKKYRLVFAREGVWWDKEKTVNNLLGMDMLDVAGHASKLLL